MPFRRSRRFRRNRRFPRRFRRNNRVSSRFVPRTLRVNNAKIHSFTRWVDLGTISTGGAGVSNNTFQYQLSQVPNPSEFTDLYDSFRIMFVKMVIIPGFNTQDTPTVVSPVTLPTIHSVIDLDDSTLLTTLAQYQQYGTYKVQRLGPRVWTRTVRPRFAQSLFASAIATGYSQGARHNWIDTAYSEAPYYGMKIRVDDINDGGLNIVYGRIYAKYYFQCKSTR